MEKGFSLDPVQINDTRISVNQSKAFPSPVFPHPAEAPFTIGNDTLPGTEVTPDFPFIQGRIIRGDFCFNETFLGYLCLGGLGKIEKGTTKDCADA